MRHLTFICHAREDREYLDRLLIHLKPFERNSTVEVWSDDKVQTGDDWRKEITEALAKAQAAVLLVTPDFLASEFIYKNELPPLLKAAKKEGLRVLWVRIIDSLYTETAIAKYQAVGDPATPLALLTKAEQDRVWVKLCIELKNATWGLSIRLDRPKRDAKGRNFRIRGKAKFRPRKSKDDSAKDLLSALSKMKLCLAPFVFNLDSGWRAQEILTPSATGAFSAKISLGEEGSADIGKLFKVSVCAVDSHFSGWKDSSDALPAVRIESNTIKVKRVG